MVGNQRPGLTSRTGFGDNGDQPLEEIITIPIILEDPLAFDTATNDMVKRTRITLGHESLSQIGK